MNDPKQPATTEGPAPAAPDTPAAPAPPPAPATRRPLAEEGTRLLRPGE